MPYPRYGSQSRLVAHPSVAEAIRLYDRANKTTDRERKASLAYAMLSAWPESPHAFLILADLADDPQLEGAFLQLARAYAFAPLRRDPDRPEFAELGVRYRSVFGYGELLAHSVVLHKLAVWCCRTGESQGAVVHLEQLLSVDWQDPLDVRHWLIALYLETTDRQLHRKAFKLLEQYRYIDDPYFDVTLEERLRLDQFKGILGATPRSVWWAYNVALERFLTGKPTDILKDRWLENAINENPEVASRLASGSHQPPEEKIHKTG